MTTAASHVLLSRAMSFKIKPKEGQMGAADSETSAAHVHYLNTANDESDLELDLTHGSNSDTS